MPFTASWDDCGRVVAGADVKLQRFGVFTVSDGDRYAFNGAKPAFDGLRAVLTAIGRLRAMKTDGEGNLGYIAESSYLCNTIRTLK